MAHGAFRAPDRGGGTPLGRRFLLRLRGWVKRRRGEASRYKVRVAKLPMNSVLRTRPIGETQAFMKARIAASDADILGFTIIGAEGGEVMAVVKAAGLPYTRLRDAIIAHPTMAEGLNSLFSNVPAPLR